MDSSAVAYLSKLSNSGIESWVLDSVGATSIKMLDRCSSRRRRRLTVSNLSPVSTKIMQLASYKWTDRVCKWTDGNINGPIGCVNGRMGAARHTPDVDGGLELVAREHPDLAHRLTPYPLTTCVCTKQFLFSTTKINGPICKAHGLAVIT